MGQGQSSLLVQLERETYSATELVRGTVYFHVSEAVDTDALVLRIVGEEHARWTEEHSSGNDNDSTTVSYSGRTQLVGHETTLGGKGTIEPGTYEFPFQFVLPTSLPGSMDWQPSSGTRSASRGRNARAAIRYYVQAMCVKPGMFNRNIRSDPLPFRLLPVCSVPYTGPAEFKDSQTSMVCCCFPKGSISGCLVLPTNVAHVGSELLIKVQLENQTSAPIKKVFVHLVQHASLSGSRGNSGYGYSRSSFVTHAVEVDTKVDQSALQPGSAPSLECRVPLPQHIPPTTFGRNIQIEYTLELLAKMGAMTKSYRLNAPIFISGTPPAAAMVPPAPTPIITSAVPGSDNSTSPYPNITGDPHQFHGGDVQPNKAMDATAPLLGPYSPNPVLSQANGGGQAPPCYSYPPMQAPPNWYPTIQKTAFLDLNAPPATNAKWADDNDW